MAYPGGAEGQSAWAGVPGGLMRGLREAGAEAVSLDSSPGQAAETALKLALAPAYPPDRWRHPGRSLLLAALGPEVARLRGRTLARRIGAAGPLDAVLVLGALATPPTDVPLVPYVDMTPRLSRDLGYPLWRGLPERALSARLRQQGELYRRAAVACPVTRFAADAIEHDFGVSPERVQVVGIGRNHEPEAPERDWSRPRFLFVGGEWGESAAALSWSPSGTSASATPRRRSTWSARIHPTRAATASERMGTSAGRGSPGCSRRRPAS